MPYRKVGPDDYVSPSGKHINGKQNRLWHSLGGRWPGEKESEMAYAKGGDIASVRYAEGGAVLGRTREFLKEKDNFRDDGQRKDYAGNSEMAKKTGDKSLKAVKPRS